MQTDEKQRGKYLVKSEILLVENSISIRIYEFCFTFHVPYTHSSLCCDDLFEYNSVDTSSKHEQTHKSLINEPNKSYVWLIRATLMLMLSLQRWRLQIIRFIFVQFDIFFSKVSHPFFKATIKKIVVNRKISCCWCYSSNSFQIVVLTITILRRRCSDEIQPVAHFFLLL